LDINVFITTKHMFVMFFASQ